MKYSEIIGESDVATAVAKANHKTSELATRYQAKLRSAKGQLDAAKRLPPGPERTRRETAAQAKRVDAAPVYQDGLRAANEAGRKAQRKARLETTAMPAGKPAGRLGEHGSGA